MVETSILPDKLISWIVKFMQCFDENVKKMSNNKQKGIKNLVHVKKGNKHKF